MRKYPSLSETLKKGVTIRSSLASRESRPLNNNNEIFVFATCGRKLYRHYVGYEQHTKFTYCQYHTEQPYLKVHLLIVGKCWHEIDLVSHFIFCYLCFYIIDWKNKNKFFSIPPTQTSTAHTAMHALHRKNCDDIRRSLRSCIYLTCRA